MNLKRGSIYHIFFPYTRDKNFPNGKGKYVLVLQEGAYFSKCETVVILLITSQPKNRNKRYKTNVEIPQGTTKLPRQSWILCAQPYVVDKSLFHRNQYKDQLSREKMEEVDIALYEGLCMGVYHDKPPSNIDDRLLLSTIKKR